jgi:hypothetical protein
MESWAEFKARNPDGLVMAQPVTNRDYGRNPYTGYDSLQRPFLYSQARSHLITSHPWPVSFVWEHKLGL